MSVFLGGFRKESKKKELEGKGAFTACQKSSTIKEVVKFKDFKEYQIYYESFFSQIERFGNKALNV